jgi:ribosomal protein S1
MEREREWESTKVNFPIGSMVEGEVIRVEPYGVFVAIPGCPFHSVLLVTEFEDGERSFDISEYPAMGSRIRAVVVDLAEHNHQLRLSTRRSRIGGRQ